MCWYKKIFNRYFEVEGCYYYIKDTINNGDMKFTVSEDQSINKKDGIRIHIRKSAPNHKSFVI